MNSSSKKKYDVITVGSATIDCFVTLPTGFHNITKGSKVLIQDMQLLTGGGGTNVAVGLSRLGLKAGFIGEMGEDEAAHIIKAELEREHVDFLMRQHSRYMTAYSVVLENKGKDRAILVYKGASSYLHDSELPKKINTDWFYFASVIGSSFKTMTHIAKYALKNKIPVFFNPSGYMIETDRKRILQILKSVTVLSLNREEAELLVQKKSKKTTDLLKELSFLGSRIYIITAGKKGVYVFDGKHIFHKTGKQIKVIDTTGAGDAFGTGFLVEYIKQTTKMKAREISDNARKKIIDKAITMGIKNAQSVIKRVGAKTGLLRTKCKKR